jgi:hypothetical protein
VPSKRAFSLTIYIDESAAPQLVAAAKHLLEVVTGNPQGVRSEATSRVLHKEELVAFAKETGISKAVATGAWNALARFIDFGGTRGTLAWPLDRGEFIRIMREEEHIVEGLPNIGRVKLELLRAFAEHLESEGD